MGSSRSRLLPILAISCVATIAACGSRDARDGMSPAPSDFRDDWALPEGFTLAIDSRGYEVPTAIAFVENPGAGPKDPLYFVTELRGAVKVVTTDRSVLLFASLPIAAPERELPALEGQTGLAGICLDEQHGHVFVTYAAADENGVLRNHVSRFETMPRTFAVEPTARVDFTEVFGPYPTAPSHQIGGCTIADSSLFIGIGDANDTGRSRQLDDLAGKIVRLTLDGFPHPENPFVGEVSLGKGARYVWAYGFRNPFGISVIEGEVFVTQNGNALDSFVRVAKGADYGWDGTDASIAINSEAVITPSVAPVQLAYYPVNGALMPDEYAGTFFFAASTSDPDRGGGVMRLRYDLAIKRVVDPPRSFVRYRGAAGGEVAAVALGRDGVYFAPLRPDATGSSPVLKVTYDPAAGYSHVIEREHAGASLFRDFGCLSCHVLDGAGGHVGPSLDHGSLIDRLYVRLNSDEYRKKVDQLEGLEEQPFASFREARREVLQADPSARSRIWIKYRLLEPRFDDPDAKMPDPELTEEQAEAIRDYLLGLEPGAADASLASRWFGRRALNAINSKGFGAGVATGLALAALAFTIGRLLLRRRCARQGS